MDLTVLASEFVEVLAQVAEQPYSGTRTLKDAVSAELSKRHLEANGYIVRVTVVAASHVQVDYNMIAARSTNFALLFSRRTEKRVYLTSPNERLLPYTAWKALEKAVAQHFAKHSEIEGSATPLYSLETEDGSLFPADSILSMAERDYALLVAAGIK